VSVTIAAIALAVWLAWSPVLLWFAKREAIKKYANMQDTDALNMTLSSKVRFIRPGDSEGQRVTTRVDGYDFSLPSAEFQILPVEGRGKRIDFHSAKLRVWCVGVLPLVGEIAKGIVGNSAFSRYFAETDPFVVLVDAFNARPKDIAEQATFDDLKKHLALLLIKAALIPIGSEKLWERIDTGKRQGILAGDTSQRFILVMMYLPECKQSAEFVVFPKGDAHMDDVYRAIGELRIRPGSER